MEAALEKRKVSFKKYEAYKAIGLEWLDRVPKNWHVVRLKALLTSEENGVWGEEPDGGSDDIWCVRVADFNRNTKTISTEKKTFRKVNSNIINKKALSIGDLLIEKSGGGEKQLVGQVVLYDHEDKAISSNFIARIRLKENVVHPNFANYLFNTLYQLNRNYRHIKQTTGIQNLDTQSYFEERVSLPPKEEQTAISSFLDRKCEQIDKAIAIKEKQIELLKERRQILIHRAVTQGLDPDVKMKESGVEWIGEVPEYWEVKKMKFIFQKMRTGTTPSTLNDKYFKGSINWYNPTDLNQSYLSESEKKISKLAIARGEASLFPGDSVLVVGIGGTTGKTAYMEGSGSFNQQITGFHSKNNHNRYYFHLVRSLSTVMLRVASYTTLPILNNSFFKAFKLPIPPTVEQRAITDHIETKAQEIDVLVQVKEKEIEKLKEYKTSLINAAVTGKVKVV